MIYAFNTSIASVSILYSYKYFDIFNLVKELSYVNWPKLLYPNTYKFNANGFSLLPGVTSDLFIIKAFATLPYYGAILYNLLI